MLANSEMIKGRFKRMHRARKAYRFIVEALARGDHVAVCTYTQARIYKSVEQFKLGRFCVYAQRGKHWDDISGAAVRVGHFGQ